MENNSDISQELLETIERYLNNTMQQNERSLFEKTLLNNTELKQKVEDVKIMLFGIETSALKEKLDIFHKELITDKSFYKKPKKVKNLSFTKYAIAASIVILLGFGGWWVTNQKSSNEKLFAKYFKPDPGLATTMSSTNNFKFYDAMVNYKHGDYNIAIGKWEALLQNKPKNDTLYYFLGVAYMANKNDFISIEHLNAVTKIENSVFKSEAFYYLGLAYLKNGESEKAINFFKQSDLEKSKQILDELN